MRIPVSSNLESRDGTLNKDARITNGFIEAKGEQDPSPGVWKRPGFEQFGFIKAGTAQMLANWNGGLRSVIGDYYCGGPALSGSYTNNTTWNPADKAAIVTLSGGDLTAAITGASWGGVRSVASQTTGSWYYETTINTLGALAIGFADSGQSLTGATYFDNAHIYYAPTGTLITASGNVGTIATAVAGDVIGVFVDLDNNLFYVFKNGTYIGGMTIYRSLSTPAYAHVLSISSAANVTCKFTGFTYTPAITNTALVVAGTNLPFWYAATGQTAGTQYLAFANQDFAWYVGNTGVPTKVTDADYPGNMTPARQTVPGMVYLDTYFFVMDVYGRVYNSAANDPTSWSALSVITAQYENGAGVAIAKSQEYLACFKEYSTELFYDAGNPVGSPLSRVDNGFFKVGCASGTSLADIKGQIFFISQSKEKGRSVHVMVGAQNSEVATPDVQRILNEDDLATVYAYGARLAGHDLYIVTLGTTGVTLCYDLDQKAWYRMTSMELGTALPYTVASLTRSGTTATWASDAPHGMSDGDAVLISGFAQTEYNGIKQIQYINANNFSFRVTGSPASPGTGTPVVTPYTETYFKYSKYANFSGNDLFLHETNGYSYAAQQGVYQDDGVPINFDVRTQKLDGGTLKYKVEGTARIVGQQVDDTCMIRWTDDDYQTYKAYRLVDLSTDFPEVRRCGKFRRRAFEIRHIGNTAPMYEAIELEAA